MDETKKHPNRDARKDDEKMRISEERQKCVGYYQACSECTAKWFGRKPIDACPCCGGKAMDEVLLPIPWKTFAARSDDLPSPECEPQAQEGKADREPLEIEMDMQ